MAIQYRPKAISLSLNQIKVSVDFMQVKSNLDYIYSHELDAIALAFNYGDSTLIRACPTSKSRSLEAKLKNFDFKTIANGFGFPYGAKVITLKFKIGYKLEFKDVLKNVGRKYIVRITLLICINNQCNIFL